MRNSNEVRDIRVHVDEDEGRIHGDILEVVLSRVPLIDLVSACRVSKSWDNAVSFSLSHLNKVKPWIVIHSQSTGSLGKSMTHAYDPRSNIWMEIERSLSPSEEIPTLRSSCSSPLVFDLSEKRLAFSSDPIHQTWDHIPPPKVWRVDPIVAVVGRHVIVAGGASFFDDDPLSVEMYDMESSHWSMCQPIPDILKDSTASTWLSVASNQTNLYVTLKASGITYSFSPNTKTWSGPYDLRPDPCVFFSAIGFAGDDLILAGLIGRAENVKSLKLWKIKPELVEIDEIAEIPIELLDELKGENGNLSSISLLSTDEFVYICKSSDPEVIIYCENVEGEWKWGSVKNIIFNETRINHRLIMSCSKVGISDLQKAKKSGNCKFHVKTNEPTSSDQAPLL